MIQDVILVVWNKKKIFFSSFWEFSFEFGSHQQKLLGNIPSKGSLGGLKVMDIMWPISQSHFHVSCLCSLK